MAFSFLISEGSTVRYLFWVAKTGEKCISYVSLMPVQKNEIHFCWKSVFLCCVAAQFYLFTQKSLDSRCLPWCVAAAAAAAVSGWSRIGRWTNHPPQNDLEYFFKNVVGSFLRQKQNMCIKRHLSLFCLCCTNQIDIFYCLIIWLQKNDA